MTDIAGAVAAAQEAAANARPQDEPPAASAPEPQAPPAAVEPAQAPAAGEQTPSDDGFSVMPLWQDKLANLPEAMRNDFLATIRESERSANEAIRKSREGSVPPEFRSFYDDVKNSNLSIDQIVDGYNTAMQMRQNITDDPYGFVEGLVANIDQAVANGDITIAEGKKAKLDLNAALDEAAPLLTDEQQKLASIEQRLNREDQRRQQEEAQRAQEQAYQNAQRFIQAGEKMFADNGLVDAEGRHVTSVDQRRAVLELAGTYKDRALAQGQDLPDQEAVNQAVARLGGWDVFKRQPQTVPPITGPTGAAPASPGAAPSGADLDPKAQAQAATDLIRRMTRGEA